MGGGSKDKFVYPMFVDSMQRHCVRFHAKTTVRMNLDLLVNWDQVTGVKFYSDLNPHEQDPGFNIACI